MKCTLHMGKKHDDAEYNFDSSFSFSVGTFLNGCLKSSVIHREMEHTTDSSYVKPWSNRVCLVLRLTANLRWKVCFNLRRLASYLNTKHKLIEEARACLWDTFLQWTIIRSVSSKKRQTIYSETCDLKLVTTSSAVWLVSGFVLGMRRGPPLKFWYIKIVILEHKT